MPCFEDTQPANRNFRNGTIVSHSGRYMRLKAYTKALQVVLGLFPTPLTL